CRLIGRYRGGPTQSAVHDQDGTRRTWRAQAGAQLPIVTETGGLKRDGDTPAVGRRISCIASGVPRNRRSALAAVLRRSRSSRVTYQHSSTGNPGRSTRHSRPRRSWWDTRCSIAGATPAPSAAAAQAAVWLWKTPMSPSATPRRRRSRAVSLPGSVPDGSTSQRHCRAGPRGRNWAALPPEATTTSRYLKMATLPTGTPCSPVTPGPTAPPPVAPLRNQKGQFPAGRRPGGNLDPPGEPAGQAPHQRPRTALGEGR